MKRSPFIAALLSLIIPGLGQIYGGEGKKGAASIVFWIWAIIDAYHISLKK